MALSLLQLLLLDQYQGHESFSGSKFNFSGSEDENCLLKVHVLCERVEHDIGNGDDTGLDDLVDERLLLRTLLASTYIEPEIN